MLLGAVISGLLHLIILVVLVIGLPALFPPEEYAAPIPVELVAVEELEIEDAPESEPEVVEQDLPPDSPPPSAPPPDSPQQQALLTPPDEAPPTPEPDLEPDSLAVPEPVVEPEPEPEVPEALEPEPEAIPEEIVEPEPEDQPEETLEPEPEPEPAQRSPPTPRRKPKVEVAKAEPKREEPPQEQPQQDFASILKNVEKLKEPPAPDSRTREAEPAARQPSRIQQDQMVRAIQQRLQTCWRLEPGARNAEALAVRVTVHFNPDGTVRDIQFADRQRIATDNFFRSAAENARRAILKCQPFNLPVREYFVWQRVNLNFDPRRMFGG